MPDPRHRRRRRSALGCALLAAALACTEPPREAAPGAEPTADAVPDDAPPVDAVPGDTAAFDGTVAPTLVERDGPVATLVAVRTGVDAAGVERVVLEFAEGAMPGYGIEYVADPRACGSGDPVRVAGGAHLVVRLTPARAHSDAGESTIAARTLAPNGSALRELAVSCDFEATLTWVLGVDRQRPYRVHMLASPPRVVVDLGPG